MKAEPERKLTWTSSFIPETYAEECVAIWLGRLTGSVQADFAHGVRRFHSLFGESPIKSGCGCSGTGITAKASAAIHRVLNARYGLRFEEHHVLACEHAEHKQGFLKKQHPDLQMLVSTLAELAAAEAKNLLNPQNCPKELIPFLLMFRLGFPCTSRTSLSSQSSENVHCVQKEEGATGIGFKEGFKYVTVHWPVLVMLECVKGLMQKTPDYPLSDMEYIVKEFEAHKYWCLPALLDNVDYGGDSWREFLWWVAVLNLIHGKVMKQEVDQFFFRMFHAFKSPGPLIDTKRYVIIDDEDLPVSIA